MTDARTVVAVPLVLAAFAAGCVAPVTGDGELRRQARLSAEAASSELATVDLATRTQLADEAWWHYTDIAVTDAERAVSTIEQTFGSRQPPRTSGQLYTRTGDALAAAADLVTDFRLAVRRRDAVELRRLLAEVGPVMERLGRVEQAAG